MRDNPYPGPQAFDATRAKYFYGRRKELRILAGLAEARRASLLFSASGAGKSSLIHAGLLPALTETRATGRGSRRRGFQKMYLVGSASVGGEPRGVEADNTYVYLALQSLRPSRGAEELARQRLADGLAPLLRLDQGTPGLLVIDQFEELFTRNVDRWPERAGFFEQLREALDRHPDLHLLLSMREEYIAELTSFAGLLPEKLQSRYRLERLKRDAALEAVTRPAAEAGCPFAGDEVAAELVDNLLGGNGGGSGDGGPAAPGEFVEPVHLQIVCRQLWQGLAEGSTEIRSEDLVAYADVDEALTEYYRAGLKSVLEAPGMRVRENALRAWFDQTDLITPSGTRGLLLRGAESTAGLANEAVDLLEAAYLVRRIRRGSDSWFELAHDRLVEPILEANEVWRREHLKPVTVAAEAWSKADEDPRRLWSGAELKIVAAEARAEPSEYSETERRFIDLSVARRRRRLWSAIGAVGALVLVVAIVLVFYFQAERERRRAEKQQYLSDMSLARNRLDQGEVVQAARTLWRTPESQRDWEWGYLLQRSYARELGDSETSREQLVDTAVGPAGDRPLIATASFKGAVTLWDPSTGEALFHLPATCQTEGGEAVFERVRFSEDGARLLTFCKAPAGGGDDPATAARARVWSSESEGPFLSEIVWRIRRPRPVDFAHTRVLALGLEEGVEIWDWDAGAPEEAKVLRSGGVSAAAFCGGGEWLAIGSSGGGIELWEVATDRRLAAPKGHEELIRAVACSSDGGRLISGSEDGTARVWAVTPRGPSPVSTLQPTPPAGKGPSPVVHVAFADGGRALTVTRHGMGVWDLEEPAGSREAAAPERHRLERAAFSRDGRRLLAEASGAALLWDWRSGEAPSVLKAPQDAIVRAEFSSDGSRVLTLFPRDRLVRFWEADPSRRDVSWEVAEKILTAQPTPDGARVVTRGAEVLARAGGTPQGRIASWPLTGHERRLDAAAFSADGRRLVTASKDVILGWVAARTEEDGWEPAFSALPEDRVEWAAFSPDGGRFVTAAGNTASVRDGSTGDLLATLAGHDDRVLHASFDGPGRRLVTASADGTARIWDAASGSELRPLVGHRGRVAFAAFSPDGRSVVTAGEDGTARLWEAESGEPRELETGGPGLEGHQGRVVWAEFSPNGTRVLTASDEDGSARIWSRDGEELAVLDGHRDLVSARFAPESRRLLLVSDGGRRVDLLAVFPFRPDQLPPVPGDRSAGWKERFARFEIEIW